MLMALRLHSLRLIYSYLVGRKQRVKIVKECSTWQEILFGVPQGSILGLLLLNIHMCDLFFVVKSIDIASYAYNTTPYVCLEDPIRLIRLLNNLKLRLMKFFNILRKMQ